MKINNLFMTDLTKLHRTGYP